MKQPIRLAILGDINTDWGWRESFDAGDPKPVFGDVMEELQSSDFAVANLELPLTQSNTPSIKTGPCLHGKTSDLSVLKAAGLSAVSLANNHILDFGAQGLLDTLAAAAAENFPTFGADQTAEAAAKPLMTSLKDWRIGFLSFAEEEFNIAYQNAPGANLFDPYCSLEQIRAAKARCDYLVVLYHGGIEHYEYPSPFLQKKCRAMVRAGADLVLCQHSHCIGTEECYHGATILYGQGNAIFGRRKTERWNTGMLVTVDFTEEKTTVSYRVFEAGEKGISFVSKEKNAARLQKMREQSACLSDEAELKKKWDAFCKAQTPEYLPMLFCWGRVRGKLNRIFKGKPVECLIGRRKKMIAMNLVRCDAHRDVVQTILENTQK
ncbi:MAG: CapA family protein [Faecousia sp.]